MDTTLWASHELPRQWTTCQHPGCSRGCPGLLLGPSSTKWLSPSSWALEETPSHDSDRSQPTWGLCRTHLSNHFIWGRSHGHQGGYWLTLCLYGWTLWSASTPWPSKAAQWNWAPCRLAYLFCSANDKIIVNLPPPNTRRSCRFCYCPVYVYKARTDSRYLGVRSVASERQFP